MIIHEQDARFDAALEDCCRRVQRGESLASCLPDYPVEYREEIAELVPLSERVSLLGRDPSPEFQAGLEGRLLAAVDDAKREQGASRRRFAFFFPLGTAFRSGAATLVVLLALTLAGAGAISASAGALPDNPLYGIKTAQEWVQMAMARGPEAKVNVHANQIVERGKELQKAVQEKKPPRVVGILALALSQSTKKMVDQALELQARGETQQAGRALVALRNMNRAAVRLAAQAQPDTRPAILRLVGFLNRQERRLEQKGVRAPGL